MLRMWHTVVRKQKTKTLYKLAITVLIRRHTS